MKILMITAIVFMFVVPFVGKPAEAARPTCKTIQYKTYKWIQKNCKAPKSPVKTPSTANA